MPRRYIRIAILTAFLPAAVFLNGCGGLPSYGSALALSDVPYIVKPDDDAHPTSLTTVTPRLGVSVTGNRLYGERDQMTFAELGVYQSRLFGRYHIAYGGSAYAGNYYARSLEPSNARKSFFGGHLTAEVGASQNFSNDFVFRPAIIRFTVLYENGPWFRYRKTAERDSLIVNNHPNHFTILTSFTNEASFKTEIGRLGLFFGITAYRLDPKKRDDNRVEFPFTFFFGPFFTYQRATGFLQIGSSCVEAGFSYAIR